jgi:DNA invertase Pin-like site-specific DNA recombinase
MVEEVKAGNIATVIIKDQSRIGRDVVEIGLLKRTFEEHNVRFIAAEDGLDTANGFDIMSLFRDVINEWFVADTSRKIKAVFKSRMEQGLRCSGSIPYGYLADGGDKAKLVIDEGASVVVRRIFRSIIEGKSMSDIAKALRAFANPDTVRALEANRRSRPFGAVRRPLRMVIHNDRLYPQKARIHGTKGSRQDRQRILQEKQKP